MNEISRKNSQCEICRPLPWATIYSIILEYLMIISLDWQIFWSVLIKSPNVYLAPWKKSTWKTPNVEYVDPLPWATICSIILESLMIFFSPRAVNESRGHYARKFATRTWFLLKYVIGVTLVIFNWLCISYIHELRSFRGSAVAARLLFTSMTSLLEHSVAQPTEHRFLNTKIGCM